MTCVWDSLLRGLQKYDMTSCQAGIHSMYSKMKEESQNSLSKFQNLRWNGETLSQQLAKELFDDFQERKPDGDGTEVGSCSSVICFFVLTFNIDVTHQLHNGVRINYTLDLNSGRQFTIGSNPGHMYFMN